MNRIPLFKLNVLILVISGVFFLLSAQPPGQPFSSTWFPVELLAWHFVGDADAPYNVGTVDLATRTQGNMQINSHARPGEALVSNLSSMNQHTALNPAQGGLEFDIYAYNYWQYTDILVPWAGTASEGLIIPPTADMIDAGHRNGVPVYGMVMFPDVAFGGQIQWVNNFVMKEGNTFPVADKLIEVAEAYNFDGWFINQETAGGDSTLAQDLRDLMVYVIENSNIHIMWYDSMVEDGSIWYQDELNSYNDMFFQDTDTVSNEMFLNYDWTTEKIASTNAHAISLGRSPYEVYAGVDVGYIGDSTVVVWDAIFPEDNPHLISFGFFATHWCFLNSTSHENFYERMNRLWVGPNRDPSNTSTSQSWKGIAHYIPASTPITETPFVTTFNTGQGHMFSVNGVQMRNSDWNYRSLQDVLPTWRWVAESNGTSLYPELDWTDAWWGGTSLKVTGDLNPGTPTTLYLYKTDLSLSADNNFVISYKTGTADAPSNLYVGLAFEDPETFEFIPVGNTQSAGWNTATLNLSQYSGRPLSVIALKFDASTSISDYDVRIGQLGIIDGDVDTPAPPDDLTLVHFYQIDDNFGTLRLKWAHSDDENLMYNVYKVNSDDSRTWLWSTPNNYCFVPQVNRETEETTTTIEVVTVGKELGLSTAVTTTFEWTVSGVESEYEGYTFGIGENFVNPISFTSTSLISFTIPSASDVSLSLYDITGRQVRNMVNEPLQPGVHSVVLEKENLASGVYFLRLVSNESHDTAKCVFVD